MTTVPPTLAIAAVQIVRRLLKGLVGADGAPITYEQLFAVEHHETKEFSRARARYYTRTSSEMTDERGMYEFLMKKSYHGGRAETYETGRSQA